MIISTGGFLAESVDLWFAILIKRYHDARSSPVLAGRILNTGLILYAVCLQVIDEYDEQSEVADRLRIKVNSPFWY